MGIGTLDEVISRAAGEAEEEIVEGGISPSILSTIGRTPLIRLQRLAAGLSARILAKVESLNPGGSIKDRVGVAMVEEAERRGGGRPGGPERRGAGGGQAGGGAAGGPGAG